MNSDQVSSLAKVTKRQLDTWVSRGWLKPQSVPGMGRGGMEREWSVQEAEKARLMGHLVGAGLLPHVAHKIATGDRPFITKLLGAVAPCMGGGELSYRWFGSDPATGGSGLAARVSEALDR